MRIPMDKFGGLFIPVAPTGEQHRIADFLDAKCAEIDVLTTDIQTQIDTLEQYKRSVITETVTKGLNPDAEMKDSGIQWIGNMPSHWEVIRGKYILRYMQKPVRDDDGVITCFRDGEVTLRSNRREDGFTMSDKEIGYQGIDIGDLVVHGMDGFAGAIGISDSRGKASPVLNVLDTNQNKRYIMYYLRSMAYSDVYLLAYINIKHPGGGFNLDGKIKASQFVQKKGEEHVSSDLVAKPVMKLPTAEHFGLSEDKEKRLSEIIDEINSKTGKNYDNDVVVKAMLQIRDILMKSDKLKTSAKNNTQQDFEFSYFDDIDDALIEGLSQNQDFFSMLLSNDEMKHQVMGIFSDEIYKSLRESV